MRNETGNQNGSRGSWRGKLILSALFIVLVLQAANLVADIVCTFIGEGNDVIHEVFVDYRDNIKITLPEKELIKTVVYNKKNFKVVDNLFEIVVRPKLEETSDYLTVITEKNSIYIFKLKTIKEEEKQDRFDPKVVIKK
jgi:hypothetical protein